MSRIPQDFPEPRLYRAFLPWAKYARVCAEGFSAVRPLTQDPVPDPCGWNYGSGYPPSYSAYGRMRGLLAAEDALALPGRSVLELAAQDGSVCVVLAEAGWSATANDLRSDLLEREIRTYRNHESVRRICGNLFDINPETTGRFDLIVACEIIEHVAHSIAFLEQCRRFLVPGGRALVTTPNGEYFHNKLPTWDEVEDFTALESQQFKPDADGHLFLLTPREMMFVGQQAGFELERATVWGSPFLTGHVGFSRISHRAIEPMCHMGERWVQRLPGWLRSRLCTAMTVVFRNPC